MRLLYLSPVPLASFAQRPHHFVELFHRRFDAHVLWIEPYPARLPRMEDVGRLRHRDGDPVSAPWTGAPWVETLRVPALPFEPLAPGRTLNHLLWRRALARVDEFVAPDTVIVVGKPCALALELARRYPRQGIVFDAMDNVPAFAQGLSHRWLAFAEETLGCRSRLVIASSSALGERFRPMARELRVVRNGLVLPAADAQHAPPRSAGDRLVLGYVGSIASWFDWIAVDRLAECFPRAHVQLWDPARIRPRGYVTTSRCFRRFLSTGSTRRCADSLPD